ncbi:MAG: ABC transporter permease [Chloroflexi bacterium]|nr:ABC transporter permease [Chloroflexota bacterium]
MTAFVVRRLLASVIVLFGVSLVVFLTLKIIPGDAAYVLAGPNASAQEIEAVRVSLGLDQPVPVQYVSWLGRALHGDLGRSLELHEPVLELVLSRYANTLILAVSAMLVAGVFGILAGTLAALHPHTLVDRLLMLLALTANSTPSFWLGLTLILVFSLGLKLLPSSGMVSARGDGGPLDVLQHLILPSVTLGAISAALIARMTRASLLEVLTQEYVLVARAKGLRESLLVRRHALKNALLPVVTVIGLQMGSLLGGAVITETIFSWPGIGFQLYRGIALRDVALVQGAALVVATSFVAINLVVDLLYSYLDPRIRYH